MELSRPACTATSREIYIGCCSPPATAKRERMVVYQALYGEKDWLSAPRRHVAGSCKAGKLYRSPFHMGGAMMEYTVLRLPPAHYGAAGDAGGAGGGAGAPHAAEADIRRFVQAHETG